MPERPQYRIIYNWDGAPHGYSPAPQSMAAFLEKAYAPLEDTQVDALFWSCGGQGSRWPSEVLEFIGEAEGRRYKSASAYTGTENIRQMYDRGEDPQEALIQRGHELGLHVYASIRMNDNHFGGAQVGDLGSLLRANRVEALRAEHPEWLLGDRTAEWFALSWNMAIPQIRQRRYDHVEEVCQVYDWDGVELDWQRHAFHFPEDEAYRLRYALTDLQRAIRRMTENLGKERGRPVYLAARVAGSLETCRRIGYDVPKWVDEGLVDILIPAGNAVTDASIDGRRLRGNLRGHRRRRLPGIRQQSSRSLCRSGRGGREGHSQDAGDRQSLSPGRSVRNIRLQLACQPRFEATAADDDRLDGDPGGNRQDLCGDPPVRPA